MPSVTGIPKMGISSIVNLGASLHFSNLRYLRYTLSILESSINPMRCIRMAATTTSGLLISAPVDSAAGSVARQTRRRISPQAGRALTILGHAIEYLSGEFASGADSFLPREDQVQAVQLLMAINRQVYMECPEVSSFGERWRALLRCPAA